jgi:hypothetical protein
MKMTKMSKQTGRWVFATVVSRYIGT